MVGLNPFSVNGLNLYSYANNNPIGIEYSGSIVSGSSNGGMVSPIVSSVDGNLNGGTITRVTNSVVMTHHMVSLIKDPVISWIFGNISYTSTVQLNSAEIFYSFSNIGNDGYSVGVGMI